MVKFTELVLAQSGSMFEATRFAAPCEVSRTTIGNYLSVLEATYVAYVVCPFSTHPPTEIVSAPKVYGFDTGFVCHARNWMDLRREDLEQLWEHIVLNELRGQFQDLKINYWRNKHGNKIDFVILNNRSASPTTIECKWSSVKFNPTNLKAFRRRYPQGKNYLVAQDIDRDYERDYDDISVSFVHLQGLIEALKKA